MRRFTIVAWIMAAAIILWTPTRALAQAVANAMIHGVVSDATGAVVPGVKVKATQTETDRKSVV